MTGMTDDYDSPWKETLERYFPAFLAFFFPAAHADIAWERGHRFLDKELQQVVRDAELGRRWADKLVQVTTRDGGEDWLLVHVEVQGRREVGFAQRMFSYNYRLFDRHARTVVSLAVLGEGRGETVGRFGYGRWAAKPASLFWWRAWTISVIVRRNWPNRPTPLQSWCRPISRPERPPPIPMPVTEANWSWSRVCIGAVGNGRIFSNCFGSSIGCYSYRPPWKTGFGLKYEHMRRRRKCAT